MILESELGIGLLLEKKKELMGKRGIKDSREKTVSCWEPGRVNQFKLEGRVLHKEGLLFCQKKMKVGKEDGDSLPGESLETSS